MQEGLWQTCQPPSPRRESTCERFWASDWPAFNICCCKLWKPSIFQRVSRRWWNLRSWPRSSRMWFLRDVFLAARTAWSSWEGISTERLWLICQFFKNSQCWYVETYLVFGVIRPRFLHVYGAPWSVAAIKRMKLSRFHRYKDTFGDTGFR